MATLREQLRLYLRDWRADLNPDWASFFAGIEPDLDAVDTSLREDPALPVIPGRRGAPYDGAAPGAHVFRAFDGVTPADVTVVVIGQDPYPRLARATGRAFEDGALADWSGAVAVSLQRLVQSAMASRYGRPELAASPAAWPLVRDGIADGSIAIELPTAWFDRLQQQHGVLFVNAGWTLTRFAPGGSPEQQAHIAMWRPLMDRLLSGLAERDGGKTVFLLLGGFARRLFEASGVEQRATAAGRWGSHVGKVVHPHPNTLGPNGYLARGNPLQNVNAVLAGMGLAGVVW